MFELNKEQWNNGRISFLETDYDPSILPQMKIKLRMTNPSEIKTFHFWEGYNGFSSYLMSLFPITISSQKDFEWDSRRAQVYVATSSRRGCANHAFINMNKERFLERIHSLKYPDHNENIHEVKWLPKNAVMLVYSTNRTGIPGYKKEGYLSDNGLLYHIDDDGKILVLENTYVDRYGHTVICKDSECPEKV